MGVFFEVAHSSRLFLFPLAQQLWPVTMGSFCDVYAWCPTELEIDSHHDNFTINGVQVSSHREHCARRMGSTDMQAEGVITGSSVTHCLCCLLFACRISLCSCA